VFTVSTNEGSVPFPEINKIEEHVPNEAELSQVRPALEQTLKESSPVYVTGIEKPADAGSVLRRDAISAEQMRNCAPRP
jgi:hypothetical protein